MHQVDFDRYSGISGRPWTTIYLLDASTNRRISVSALVDTGADVTQLPASAAHSLGLSLAGARTTIVQTAGGPQTTQRLSVEVQVFSKRFSTDVDFSSNPVALVGRESIFAAGSLTVLGLSDVDLYEKD